MFLNERVRLWAMGDTKWRPKNMYLGAKEMAKPSRALTAPAEDTGSVPSSQSSATPAPGEPVSFSGLYMHMAHRHSCRQNTDTQY